MKSEGTAGGEDRSPMEEEGKSYGWRRIIREKQ